MSSFIRRMQRSVERAKDPACRAPHYMGRGSKLGVPVASPWPPKKKEKKRKPALTLAERKALRKARVSTHGKVLAKRGGGFDGHLHGYPGMLPEPLANLSRNHPDYGCTPAEHARRKAERNV